MKRQVDKDGTITYKYPQCPACKSKRRHYEEVSKKGVKLGTVKPGLTMPFRFKSQIMADPTIEATLPMGAEVPIIQTAEDICMDCGCVYVALAKIQRAKKDTQTVESPATQKAKKLWRPGQS